MLPFFIILYISHFGSVEPDGLRDVVKQLFKYRRTLISGIKLKCCGTLFKLPVASVQDHCVFHPNPVGDTHAVHNYVHMTCSSIHDMYASIYSRSSNNKLCGYHSCHDSKDREWHPLYTQEGLFWTLSTGKLNGYLFIYTTHLLNKK